MTAMKIVLGHLDVEKGAGAFRAGTGADAPFGKLLGEDLGPEDQDDFSVISVIMSD